MGTDIKPNYGPEKKGDVKHSLADITKAREILKYEVLIDFDEGLRKTVEWFG
jgi:UDP-N-acetylglucosamine 4-epimerase